MQCKTKEKYFRKYIQEYFSFHSTNLRTTRRPVLSSYFLFQVGGLELGFQSAAVLKPKVVARCLQDPELVYVGVFQFGKG